MEFEGRVEKKRCNDAGYDIFAQQAYTILSLTPTKISTGVKIKNIPEDIYLQVADRSSLGAEGLKVHGGVIDNGYRGEIIVILNYLRHGEYHIAKGQKIAQLIPINYYWDSNHGASNNERGDNGFGSSGAF